SDTHSSLNMMGLQNTSDDIIMNLVMGTMFLVLPAVWLGALSWAGVSIGTVVSDAINKGTGNAANAASKSGDIASKLK
ncbi:conjugal transfer protein TraG N-terminal domain-containing protein, partial [Escherichia coli]